ncbi:hypothetical protein [Kitasatospora sp. Root107]|uniref:hypothetical protein n=1 Tax=Kitasatospora sp. Root107 TaxID=1736424 RepID=UPI00070FD8CA|nr:hypothetical protein [Kitasatospora sp. Root107]KQV11886.1 hypothetical protein ASC99_35820 [Kitasatospora sp. Root107]
MQADPAGNRSGAGCVRDGRRVITLGGVVSAGNQGRAVDRVWVLVRILAALVFATGRLLLAKDRVIATWHWCLTQGHEPDPDRFRATVCAWAVMIAVLLVLGAVLDRLPYGCWYLLPAMAVAAAVLGWLYVIGMGSPAPLGPGEPEEAACWTMPIFPFIG